MFPFLIASDHYMDECRKNQVVLVQAVESYIEEAGHEPDKLEMLVPKLLKTVPTCWSSEVKESGSSYPVRIVIRGTDFWIQTYCAYHHTLVERLSEGRLRPSYADDIPWIKWEGEPPPPKRT